MTKTLPDIDYKIPMVDFIRTLGYVTSKAVEVYYAFSTFDSFKIIVVSFVCQVLLSAMVFHRKFVTMGRDKSTRHTRKVCSTSDGAQSGGVTSHTNTFMKLFFLSYTCVNYTSIVVITSVQLHVKTTSGRNE